MKLARLQVDEMAAPVLTLVRDGAFYDVAALEDHWRVGDAAGVGGGFHARVVAGRCAGLMNLDARLASGQRPTEARVLAADVLPLPPCVPSRAAYLQAQPFAASGRPLRVERRDARMLVGDAQPVVFPAGGVRPHFEPGVAVLVGEELHGASTVQARRAIIGVTAVIDWTCRSDWSHARWEPFAPSQLGPVLLTGSSMQQALRRPVTMQLAGGRVMLPAPERAAERLAAISAVVALAPGDVVGLGGLSDVPVDRAAFGEQVSVTLHGAPPLRGWALAYR